MERNLPPGTCDGEPPLLDIRNLSYSYHTSEGETLALSDISFSVNKGEFIAVAGPSGCGKSTLLSLIIGLLSPDEGAVLLKGAPVGRGMNAASDIGYMPQRDHLFEWRSVFSNIHIDIQGHTIRPGAAVRCFNSDCLFYGFAASAASSGDNDCLNGFPTAGRLLILCIVIIHRGSVIGIIGFFPAGIIRCGAMG